MLIKSKQIKMIIAISILSFITFASPNLMAVESAAKSKPLPVKQTKQQTAVQTTPSTPPFDHTRTGFILRDIHTTLRCEQCHVGEIFKGTPKECSGCHSIGSRVAATPRPVNHVVTNAACDTCHVTPTSFLVSSFNHVGVTDKCSSCHNGQSLGVVSKPSTHFPTFLPCETCHTNTTIFEVARMDHTGITTNCTTCHSGSFPNIVSKPSAHITTTGGCEACHNTITFAGATYGHVLATVQNNCISCHGGPMPGITGRPSSHLPTSGAQCDTCHTQSNTGNFTTFVGARYSHTAGTNCSSCHNGSVSGAQGKPGNHLTTSAQCDTCHTTTPDRTTNYTTWGAAYYDHTTVVVGQCATCHNGTGAKGQPTNHIPTGVNACDASGCHNQGTYISFLGATFNHPANLSIVTGKCSTCHGGAYPGVKTKNSGHIATSAQCDTCHTPTNTSSYTTFLGAGQDHTGYTTTTNCETCHNGVQAVGKTGGHIPLTGLSVTGACGLCHAKQSASAPTFYPGTMDHTKFASTRCDSCHNGSYSSQGIAGGALPKISTHIPTTITGAADCTTCHNITKTANSSGMSWATMTMNHNGAQGMGSPIYCVTCHLRGNTYTGGMRKFSHNGASTSKDCSSSSCHKPIGNKGTSWSAWTN